MDKRTGLLLSYIFVSVMGVLLLYEVLVTPRAVERIPYSRFQSLLREDKVAEAVISEDDCSLRAIVERAFKHARRVLERNRQVLEEGAAVLSEEETMSESELAAIFARLEKEPPLVTAARVPTHVPLRRRSFQRRTAATRSPRPSRWRRWT